MSHNLNTENGKVAFAYAEEGTKPWHGLGQKVPGAMTMEQAIVLGGLDWQVEKQALITVPGISVPDFFATVRMDTGNALGVVGNAYEVVQNRNALRFFDSALGKGAAAIDTVGALGKGEVIWAMAKIPDIVEIAPGDPIEHYLLLTSSHDGSSAIKALFTPVRVVCNNTLSSALKGAKQVVSIKHTRNVEDALDAAHKVLAEGNRYWDRVRGAFKWLAKTEMTTETVQEFLEKLFPAKTRKKEVTVIDPETGEAVTTEQEIAEVATRTLNTRNQILELFEGDALGADLAGKTAWGMFNAVTEYVDWQRKSRTGINNWQNSVFGLGANLRQKAFEILTESADQSQFVTLGA